MPWILTPIATTGERSADFRPYVAAMGVDGAVVFQAGLAGGGTGVFVGGAGAPTTLALDGASRVRAFSSHPAVDARGAVSVYAELDGGGQGVVRLDDGGVSVLVEAGPGAPWAAIGPLGPTVNAAGVVAFRATTAAGRAAVGVGAPGAPARMVADTGERFAGFEGLPVVTDDGAVVFRAELARGGQGIYRGTGAGAACTTIVETGADFAELGRFPAAGAGETVVFVATRTDGRSGVFAARDGRVDALVESGPAFAGFRGALVDGRGAVVFYATPPGGALAVFARPGAGPVERVLGVGDLLLGAPVTALALNPVSIDRAGRLALRVELAGGGQAIVAACPSPP